MEKYDLPFQAVRFGTAAAVAAFARVFAPSLAAGGVRRRGGRGRPGRDRGDHRHGLAHQAQRLCVGEPDHRHHRAIRARVGFRQLGRGTAQPGGSRYRWLQPVQRAQWWRSEFDRSAQPRSGPRAHPDQRQACRELRGRAGQPGRGPDLRPAGDGRAGRDSSRRRFGRVRRGRRVGRDQRHPQGQLRGDRGRRVVRHQRRRRLPSSTARNSPSAPPATGARWCSGGEYRYSNNLPQTARDWAFPAISSLSGTAQNGSFFSPGGVFFADNGGLFCTMPKAFGGDEIANVFPNCPSFAARQAVDNPDQVELVRYDYALGQDIWGASEVYTFAGYGTYDVTDGIEAFLEMQFAKRQSEVPPRRQPGQLRHPGRTAGLARAGVEPEQPVRGRPAACTSGRRARSARG